MNNKILSHIYDSPYYRQLRSSQRKTKHSVEPSGRLKTEYEEPKGKYNTSLTRKTTLGQDLNLIIGIMSSKAQKTPKFSLRGRLLKTEIDSDVESRAMMLTAKKEIQRHQLKPKFDSSKIIKQEIKAQRSLSNVTPKQKSQERYMSLDSQKKIPITPTHHQQKLNPQKFYDMSDEEYTQFGDRFPHAFEKKKLLGRGGFSLVWLGENKKTKQKFAIKQILSNNTHQSHMKEIWFGQHFFENGQPKPQFSNFPGCKNLVRFLQFDIQKQDTWIFQEVCGESLGNHLYDLQGEAYQGERVYRITHQSLYNTFRKDQKELKRLIYELSAALDLLQDQRIVHSDLKTENILIKKQKKDNDVYMITSIKLIDYGSSFPFDDLKQFSMATPEYMCPEILNYILYENQLNYNRQLIKYLQNYKKPWVIDVWSLGCVILEIISGIPLWMSLKTIVSRKDKDYVDYGLFAVKGRVFDKIIERQIAVVMNLDQYLDNNYSGIKIDDDIRFLIKGMLSLDPEKRLSPQQIMEHLKYSNL